MYQAKLYCLFIVNLVLILFLSTKKEKTTTNKLYSLLLFDAVAQMLLDLATVYTVNNMDTVPAFVNDLVHRLSFTTLILFGYLTFKYIRALIEHEIKITICNKKCKIISSIPVILSLIVISFFPIHYILNERTNYSAGIPVYVIYLNMTVYVVLIFIMMIKFRAHISKSKKIAILLAFITEFGTSLYQFINPTSLVSCFGVTILVLGFYVTTENHDSLLVEKLKKVTREANSANRAKTSFLANMSHEIRTPINTVLGMSEMILRECDDAHICTYSADIKSAAKSLLNIVNDILDITKIEEGKLAIIPVEYHLASVLYDVFATIDFKAKEKGLEFKIVTIGPLPSVLIGDDIRLKQILINLLNNAVKYTHEGSVTLEIKQIGPDTFFFSVKDTGIGIKEEDLEKLFIPFERIEKKRNRNIEGTGIGLNITQKLLTLMESDLSVKSVYGEGSDFSFILKQSIVDPTPIDVKNLCKSNDVHEDHYWISFEAPNAKILVVDDNDLNRRVFRNLLKETKIKVIEASGGQESVDITKEQKFDLIFMDHMMPIMDGIQALKAIREDPDNLCRETKVIALTANALVGAKEFYFNAGFDEFLSKPIDPQKLEEMVYSMLDDSLISTKKRKSEEPKKEIKPVDLPIINGIDWNYAKLHFNDEGSLLETVRIFYKTLKKDANELEFYFDHIDSDGGLNDYQVKVHSMKNSAMLIGNIQLSGMAMALENAAKNSDCDAIMALHSLFIKKWLGYSNSLSRFAENSSSKKNAADYTVEVSQIFDTIRQAAADMDVDVLDEMSKKLDEYSFDEDTADKIEEVKAQILNFEIEKLMECKYF